MGRRPCRLRQSLRDSNCAIAALKATQPISRSVDRGEWMTCAIVILRAE
jgi:hypothetical protein